MRVIRQNFCQIKKGQGHCYPAILSLTDTGVGKSAVMAGLKPRNFWRFMNIT